MKYCSSSAYKAAMTKNPHMTDFEVLSRRQIELGYKIRLYRELHNMTTTELAFRCSCFGKPFKVKFADAEISQYERLKHIPCEKKMNVLMLALGIKMEDLNKRN